MENSKVALNFPEAIFAINVQLANITKVPVPTGDMGMRLRIHSQCTKLTSKLPTVFACTQLITEAFLN